jgi:hypothetical protein
MSEQELTEGLCVCSGNSFSIHLSKLSSFLKTSPIPGDEIGVLRSSLWGNSIVLFPLANEDDKELFGGGES